MSELPPNAGPPDDVDLDDRYRRAAALKSSRPSDSMRRAVLEHAAKLAAERLAAARPAEVRPIGGIPTRLGVERSVANQRWRRPAIFGTLAAAGLAGLLIAPQYLPRRQPSIVAQSKIEAPPPQLSAAAPPPSAAPTKPLVSQSPVPSPPVMAQAQSMAKDRAAAGNVAANAESAQDKASGITEALTARQAGRVTDARRQDSAAELRQAAESGDIRALKIQLEKTSDIDGRDGGGRTALMLATLHGQRSAVEELLSAGADANAADAGGVTPLQAAMNSNQPAIAAALRHAGAR